MSIKEKKSYKSPGTAQWCQRRQSINVTHVTPRHLLPHDVRHRHQDRTEASYIHQLNLDPFLEFTYHLQRTMLLHHLRLSNLPGGTQPYITIIPVELCRGWAIGRSVFCLVMRFLAFINRRHSCAEDVAGSLVEKKMVGCVDSNYPINIHLSSKVLGVSKIPLDQ